MTDRLIVQAQLLEHRDGEHNGDGRVESCSLCNVRSDGAPDPVSSSYRLGPAASPSRPARLCGGVAPMSQPDLFAGKHVMLKGARELRAEDIAPQVRARFEARLRARTWSLNGAEITCVEWTGATNTDGHGVVQIIGRPRQRFAMAHRLAYALAHGVCPEGLVVDHIVCDNRRCCDPAHLRLTTPEGNTPAIYGTPAEVRRQTDHPLRAIVDGVIVVYPSVAACFEAMERRSVARYGPRCTHGLFHCATCQRQAARTPVRAVANTWSDEPGGANVAERGDAL